MIPNLKRAASELAKKMAGLPARYPYIGAAEKNVYLFTPTETERDLMVKALCAFAAAPAQDVELLRGAASAFPLGVIAKQSEGQA
jgi:hypothetical protein